MSQNKLLILETILRNPKLKKQFEDAYGAPIGSTKRQSMKNTVSNIKKIGDRKFSNKQDGQGGSSGLDTRYDSYNAFLTSPYSQSTSISVPKAAPANIFSKDFTPKSPVLGETSDKYKFNLDQSGNIAPSTPAPSISSLSSSIKGTAEPLTVNSKDGLLSGGVANSSDQVKGLSEYSKPGGSTYLDMTGNVITDPVQSILTKQDRDKKAAQKLAEQVKAKTNGTIVVDPTGKIFAKDPAGKLTYISSQAMLSDYVNKKKYADIRSTPTGKITATSASQGAAPLGGTTMYGPEERPADITAPSGVSGISSSMGLFEDTLGVESGPLSQFMRVMSDEKLKRQYFPGRSEAWYKDTSSNLNAMLGDMKNSLRTEYDLDAEEKKYKDILLSQENIVPELTDYIKRRDTAIKDLDGTILKAEKNAAAATASTDPLHAKAQENYITNLYTLRSRQTARYSDLLNQAQQRADKVATRAYNDLTEKTAKYTDEFNTKAAITTEDYNNMKALFTEMYTQADNLDAKINDKKALALAGLELDMKTNALLTGEVSDSVGIMKMSDLKNVEALALSQAGETNGQFAPGVNIATVLAEYPTWGDADGNSVQPQYAIATISKGIKNGLSVKSKDAAGDVILDTTASLKNLGDYLDQISSSKATLSNMSPSANEKGVGIYYTNVANAVLENAKNLIKSYTTGNLPAIQTAVEQLKDLDISDSSAISSWKGKNSSVPKAILDDLVNTWIQNKKNGAKFNEYFNQDKKGTYGKQFFGDIIADRIYNGIYTKLNT